MQVPRVKFAKLQDIRPRELSAEVCARVEIAWEHHRKRFTGMDIASNADMYPAQIRQYFTNNEVCQALMKAAMRQVQLTAEANYRVLKLSHTIADQDETVVISQIY